MRVVLLIAFAASVAVCNALTIVDDDEWEQYKAKYGKSYESDAVEKIRKQIYASNKRFVEKHNERYDRGETSYFMGINRFSDMLGVEVAQKMNGYKQGNSQREPDIEVFDVTSHHRKLPKTVDWRKKNIVTNVKDQGECGGCWAFSATGSLEGQHALKKKKLVSLSEENLIDCSSAEGNLGCDGGVMDWAFKYVKKNKGIDTEASYPFTDYWGTENTTCKFKRADVGATLKSWVNVKSGSEKALEEAVARKGPVSVAIDASLDSFSYYAGGVYDDTACSSTDLDHGVLAVGYGVHENKKYWLVKNSWGTDWGIEGYIMMSKDKDNQCGIATEASYPVV